MKPGFEVYQSAADDKWYWRLLARNAKIVAQGQGYTRERDCRRALRRIKALARVAK